jgi:hypothetical protein
MEPIVIVSAALICYCCYLHLLELRREQLRNRAARILSRQRHHYRGRKQTIYATADRGDGVAVRWPEPLRCSV